MSENKPARREGGRLLGGVLLGLLIGLASPYMLALAPVVLLAPVLTARLYAYAGVWAACASCAAQLIAASFAFGPAVAAVLLVMQVAPLAVSLWLLKSNGPGLADALRVAVPAWMLCSVLALTLAQWLVGMSLADYVAQLVREQLEALPAGVTDMLLSMLQGESAPASLNLLSYTLGFLDPAERARGIESLATQLRNGMTLLLPGMLLCSAALTALLSVAWPMRALARSGGEWERRYLPLGRWHLPASLAVFATASYVVGLIISATAPVSGLLTVGLTLEAVATLAFRVQAVGSAQRRLTAMGMRPGLRALLILMCLLLAPFDTLFVYYGMFSALFGQTYGVVTNYLKKRRADRGDGDDFFGDDDDP